MVAEAWAPACMDGDDLAGWQVFNDRLRSAGNRVARPCADCLPAFADEMRSVGRCNGTPGGAKEETPVAAAEPLTIQVRTQHVARHVTVPNLPCRSCIHAPVCRIRPGLEDTALPEFDVDPAIHAHLSVTCDFYAEDGSVPKMDVRKPALAPAQAVTPPGGNRLSPEGRERIAQAARDRAARQRAARCDAEPGDPS